MVVVRLAHRAAPRRAPERSTPRVWDFPKRSDGGVTCRRKDRSRSSSRSTARVAAAASAPARKHCIHDGDGDQPAHRPHPGHARPRTRATAAVSASTPAPSPTACSRSAEGADFELEDPEKLFGARHTDAPEPVDIPDESIPLPEDAAARHQGKLRRGDRRAPRGLPPLLRLPDHPLDRRRRADGQAPAEARRRVPAGGQRGRRRSTSCTAAAARACAR